MSRDRLLVVLLVVMVLGVGLRLDLEDQPAVLVEAVLVLGMTYVVASRPAVQQLLARLAPGYRAAVVVLVGLPLVGHLTSKPFHTFPFVDWYMYGYVPKGDPFHMRLLGTTRAGATVDLVPGRVLPAIGEARINHKLWEQIDDWNESEDADERALLMDQHVRTVAAIGRLYNEEHGDDPLTTIGVWRYTVPIHPYAGPDAIVRELLWDVPVR